MGRREGPDRTHHSVGFAGWLALAGRSTSSLPSAPLLRRPLRALGIAARAALTGARGRRAVPPQLQPPALWAPRQPGRQGRRCGRIPPGCPAAAAPQLPAPAAAMLALIT